MQRKRPVGVTVIAVLILVGSLTVLGVSLLPALAVYGGVVLMFWGVSVFGIILSYGMLRGWSWVWYLALAFWVLSVLALFVEEMNPVTLFMGNVSYEHDLAIAVPYMILIVYWLTKGVRRFFKVAKGLAAEAKITQMWVSKATLLSSIHHRAREKASKCRKKRWEPKDDWLILETFS